MRSSGSSALTPEASRLGMTGAGLTVRNQDIESGHLSGGSEDPSFSSSCRHFWRSASSRSLLHFTRSALSLHCFWKKVLKLPWMKMLLS